MKHILSIFALSLMSLAAATGSAVAGSKVTICHMPPGNPGSAHTIIIGENALPAHLGHGDHEGECGSGASMAGSSVVAAAGAAFVICDDRVGEMGRMISISAIGRVSNERLECD